MEFISFYIILLLCFSCCHCSENDTSASRVLTHLSCDANAESNTQYQPYFKSMKHIFDEALMKETCIPSHKSCGWPKEKSELPLFVFAVGAEGSGHHLWQNLLTGVMDCVWVWHFIILFVLAHNGTM
jgi:hypothetical protein